VADVNIDKQIRVLVKEELDKQLGEIREKLSSISDRVDEVERKQGKKWNLILRLRKHTLDELMSEYRKIKEEMHKTTEEQAAI
jgi:ribosomal protein L29